MPLKGLNDTFNLFNKKKYFSNQQMNLDKSDLACGKDFSIAFYKTMLFYSIMDYKNKICFVLRWYCDEIAYMYNVCVKMFRTPRIEGV